MATTDTVLLGVAWDYIVKIGLPPKNKLDSFNSRATIFGKVKNVSHVACSPQGELFCIRSGDLYRGPLPSNKDVDWFSVARRVGKYEWNRVKLILFHPEGDFYCTTHDGEFYVGPQPDNEHLTWLYGLGRKIGKRHWNNFDAIAFHPDGTMYAVSNNDIIYRGPPPTHENFPWTDSSSCVGRGGWSRLTHFMSFTPDGKLWFIDKYNGNLYRGDPPTPEDTNYLKKADYLGWSYNDYRFFAYSKDKTICKVLSLEFLPEEGDKVSEIPEIIEEKIYENTSSSTLKHNFKFSKSMKETSSFTHDHGFSFQMGTETTFKTGIPKIAEGEVKVSVNMSTTHNWSFTTVNETESFFESETVVELEAGKSIRMVVSVMKAKMDVPYKAKGRTMFDSEIEFRGKWLGVTHYNLVVKQEDYRK